MKSPYISVLSVMLCIALLTTPLTGCGGGKEGAAPNPAAPTGPVTGTGRATLTILWTPRVEESSRLIPIASRGLRVSLQKNTGELVAERVVPRPVGQNETTVTFDDLPVETLRVAVSAHPQEDGTGTAQAQAETLVAVNIEQNAPIRVRLQSTIARLEVKTDKPQVKVDETANVLVSAKNDADELVMISMDTLEFIVSEELTLSGASQVTGALIGTARIEVLEKESGKKGSAELPVGRSGDYYIREIVAPAGLDGCRPTGMNNGGYVVGQCIPVSNSNTGSPPPDSFAWDLSTRKSVILPRPPGIWWFLAADVNDARQIAGYSQDGKGLLLENESRYTSLQQLLSRDTVVAINNRGEILGSTEGSGNRAQIALWKTDGTGRILNLNNNSDNKPFAMNDQGVIVGRRQSTGFVWNTDGRAPARLLPISGTSAYYTLPFDVNDTGRIVGLFPPQQTNDGGNLSTSILVTWEGSISPAVAYLDGIGAAFLRTRTNNRNEIIAVRDAGTFPIPAYLWANGLRKDVATLVPADWKKIELMCINDRGQIAGTAERNGKKTMFLLTPQGVSGDLKVGVR
jgi:hypothetical protein